MNELQKEIIQLKEEKNAIILAHNYQPKEIQEIADFLGDSLELCIKASEIDDIDLVIFCGVDFMAETAYRRFMKKEKAGTVQVWLTRIAPASVVAYQPRWSVSNLIFCVPAAFAAVIASSSVCPDRRGTCSYISRTQPIPSLFRARRKASPRCRITGISGDTSSRSRFCPPILSANSAELRNL